MSVVVLAPIDGTWKIVGINPILRDKAAAAEEIDAPRKVPSP